MKESDFARLERSMENSVALDSLGFCIIVRNRVQNDCRPTYGQNPHIYAVEDTLKEDIIFGKRLEDVELGGDINKDCESGICDWLCNT